MVTLLALACVQEPDAKVQDDTGLPEPVAPDLTELTDGECPDFSETGSSKFSSNGQERKVFSYFPEGRPSGMPLVYVWHGLGGTGNDMDSWLDLQGFADELGALVLAPNALDANLFGWDFWNEGTDDPALFDDLRTCASMEFGVDLTRVSTTGISAGGLWSSWLGMHRGAELATILPFSGGSEPIITYVAPDAAFPALLVYGGESDTWGGGGLDVNFAETTINYANDLVADGHEVVLCNHDTGHTIPIQGRNMMDTWLTTQRLESANPVSVDELPNYCVAYDGSLTP